MSHPVHVLAEDVYLAVVAQQQVVVHVDRAAKRVLNGHGRIVHVACCEAGKDLVKGAEAHKLTGTACSGEDVGRTPLAVGARLALVGAGRSFFSLIFKGGGGESHARRNACA